MAGSWEGLVKGPFFHWTHNNNNNKRPATLDWTNAEKKHRIEEKNNHLGGYSGFVLLLFLNLSFTCLVGKKVNAPKSSSLWSGGCTVLCAALKKNKKSLSLTRPENWFGPVRVNFCKKKVCREEGPRWPSTLPPRPKVKTLQRPQQMSRSGWVCISSGVMGQKSSCKLYKHCAAATRTIKPHPSEEISVLPRSRQSPSRPELLLVQLNSCNSSC